jgi:hypothetical protein
VVQAAGERGGPGTPEQPALYRTDSGEARVGTLDGADGAVRFTDLGAATLRVTDDADMTFSGDILGSNRLGRVVKEGAGTLTFDSGTSDHFGVLDIQAGDLVLNNGAGVLGTLSLATGTAAEVFGRTGLEMRFYNRSASDAEYGEFNRWTRGTPIWHRPSRAGPTM